jgi:tetratricopeptide (TPR) repeat protein
MLINVLRSLFGRPAAARPAPVVQADPGGCAAAIEAGLAAHAAGRHAEAEGHLRRALAIDPDHVDALHLLGVVLQRLRRWREAIHYLDRAANLGATDAELSYHRGTALQGDDDIDRAAEAFAEAIARKSDFAAAHAGLGGVLRQRGQWRVAIACFRRAVEHDPGVAEAWHNLASILYDTGDAEEAIAAFDRALALDPLLAEARFSRALAVLLQGGLAAGWEAYESRVEVPRLAANVRSHAAPVWQGEPLSGRTLLVHGEQGVGDELTFSSLFPDLFAGDGRYVLECRPKLVPLFARSFPRAVVVARTDPPDVRCVQGVDCRIAAGSLARLLRPTLASFSAQRGHLVADAARVAYWRARLDRLGPGLKVGFSWRSGNLGGVRALTCTTLDQWGELFAVPAVHWICLQYDECEAELAQARQRFGVSLHRDPEVDYFDDLDEVGALMGALDLVITAPTTVSVHSAALGVETWQMSFGADWQTFGTRRNPWLPAMVRHERGIDQSWEDALSVVAAALRARAAQASGLAVAHPAQSPRSVDAMDRALAAFQQGRPADCRTLLIDLVRAGRADADVWQLLGMASQSLGDGRAALDGFLRAAEARPELGAAWVGAGGAALGLGDHATAIRAYEQALAHAVDLPVVHLNLGRALEAAERADDAIACYRDAIGRDPRLGAAHLNLGILLCREGRLDEARSCLERAVELTPDSAKARSSLGLTLHESARVDEAEAAYRAALAIDPGSFEARLNLGSNLFCQGRHEEALPEFERALEIVGGPGAEANLIADLAVAKDGHIATLLPEVAQAGWNLGLARLMQGDTVRGWPLLECRLHASVDTACKRALPQPAWRGEPLAGRTLFVHGEQGVGDEILFSSLIPDLVAGGGRIVLECRRKLAPLFSRSFPAVTFVVRTDNADVPGIDAERIDWQIASGSLARYLRPTVSSFPATRGHLVADAQRVEHWKNRISALGPGLKVGFSWRSGNLKGVRALTCTRLDQWGELFAVPGVHWICLQYDDCEAELADARSRFGVKLHRYADVDYFDDLDEVAALTCALDLVVTAPTTVSVQAAALGVETWQMSFGADWQTLGTQRNPWLPATVRYERRRDQSWDEMLSRVAADLRARTAAPFARPLKKAPG